MFESNVTTDHSLFHLLIREISSQLSGTVISERASDSGSNSSGRIQRKRTGFNVRAALKCYRVGQMKNYSLTTCRCSEGHEGHSIAAAKGSRRRRGHQSWPHKDARRLIYDRNDRTDSCKLRVVSHNLGIRSLSLSLSFSLDIEIGNRGVGRFDSYVPIIYKAAYMRVCVCVCATKSRSRKKIAILNEHTSNFVRSRIHISSTIDNSIIRFLSLYFMIIIIIIIYKTCTNLYQRSRKNKIQSY